jgi:hypothetical protein
MVRAAAMAARSTTLTNSRNKSSRCMASFLLNAEDAEENGEGAEEEEATSA